MVSSAQSRDFLIESQSCFDETLGQTLIEKYLGLKDPHRWLYTGIVYHNLAGTDSARRLDHLENALKYTEKAVKTTEYPLARAYYGSIIILEANEFFKKNDYVNALNRVNRGGELIDGAVSEAPDNSDIRFLRINLYVGLSQSSPFKRYEQVREDLTYYEKEYNTLTPGLKAMFNLYSGIIEMVNRDILMARVYFNEAVKLAPGSVYAQRALEFLKKINQ